MLSIDDIRAKTTPVFRKNRVAKAGLFGSFAKQNSTVLSDIDILVAVEEHASLLDLIGIKLELEEALNTSVDLVEYDGLKPALKKSILESEIPLYG